MRVSEYMKKVIPVLCAASLVLLLAGCERLFTTSVFSGLQRDPSRLSLEQQVAYAENALASGDKDAVKKAYDALAKSLEESDEPEAELLELAGDLAISASGINDELLKLTGAAESGSFSDTDELAGKLEESLDEVDYAYIDSARDHLEAAAQAGGEVSEEQYVTVAAGLAMKAENDGTGMENSAELEDFVNGAVSDLGPDYDGPLKDLQGAL